MSGVLSLRAQPGGVMPDGQDLALSAPVAVAGNLPAGTLLDDHLDVPARLGVEAEARERAARWAESRRSALVVDGIDLAWVWEVEIYHQAALAAVRFVRGVSAASCNLERPVRSHALNDVEAAALVEAGARVEPGRGAGLMALGEQPVRLTRLQQLAIRAHVPVPQWVRGDIRVINHWALEPLIRALAEDGRLVPVLDPGLLPALPARELLSLSGRGGWIGSPGPVRYSRSQRSVRRCLATLAPAGADALDRLIDQRARLLLAERAPITPALVDRQRRAFARDKIRLVVLPFDSIAAVRSVLVAAREHEVPSLLVQHGFPGEPHDPDMREADHLAVWSAHVDRGRPTVVTGNPAAPAQRSPRRSRLSPGRTVLLVQPPSVLSVRWDARVSRRSVELGLGALSVARPGSTVVLRPHPNDPDPHAHAQPAPGLQVTVDRSSRIEDLLATCDLCIGGVSTATLQAAALGVPVIFLDVTGLPIAWPFDGSTELPLARDEPELVTQIARALEAPEVLGGEALAEALGVGAGALDRLMDLVMSLARDPGIARRGAPA